MAPGGTRNQALRPKLSICHVFWWWWNGRPEPDEPTNRFIVRTGRSAKSSGTYV